MFISWISLWAKFWPLNTLTESGKTVSSCIFLVHPFDVKIWKLLGTQWRWFRSVGENGQVQWVELVRAFLHWCCVCTHVGLQHLSIQFCAGLGSAPVWCWIRCRPLLGACALPWHLAAGGPGQRAGLMAALSMVCSYGSPCWAGLACSLARGMWSGGRAAGEASDAFLGSSQRYVGGKWCQTRHPSVWVKECFEEKQCVWVGKVETGTLLFASLMLFHRS